MVEYLENNIFFFFQNSILRLVEFVLSIFQKPNKSDSGDYKCSVKNKWGNDHTTFNLG